MARDAQIKLRDGSNPAVGNLVGNENAAPFQRIGPLLEPMRLEIDVPNTVPACTLQINIIESADGINPGEILQMVPIAVAGTYYTTIITNHPFVTYAAAQVGGPGNWGPVDIGPVPAGRYTNH